MSQPTAPWQGNLPCVHGPGTGCVRHRPAAPASATLFFDPTLPSHTPATSLSILKGLFTRSSGGGSSKSAAVEPPSNDNQIWSTLPRTESNLRPLLPLHPSIPYNLALYHVHAAVQTFLSSQRQGWATSAMAGVSASCPLTALACAHPSIGTRPTLSYAMEPRVHPATGTFLLASRASFAISPPGSGGPSEGKSFRYSKNWFVSRGFRSFRLCAHMTRVFRSIRVEEHGGNPAFMAGVEFALKNILGQEFGGEWRSELGYQPVNVSCGVCATDTAMAFTVDPVSGFVTVVIHVHRDLGAGREDDAMWKAAVSVGVEDSLRRRHEDFGRVRRQWEEAGSAVGKVELPGNLPR